MFTMYSMPFVISRARDLVLEHCSRALCVSTRTGAEKINTVRIKTHYLIPVNLVA
jgi:hypothetical protein